MKISENNFRIDIVKSYLNKIKLKASINQYYCGNNILVTGGAGAIGTNLVIALSEIIKDTGKIIVVDNYSAILDKKYSDFPKLQNVIFIEGDIKDDIVLKRCFREKPNIIFHLAAFFANQRSVDFPEKSIDTDIIGLIKLLDYSIISGIEKFIYASSGCSIYGSYGKLPLKEDFMSMHLTTPYQINKMAGEMYVNYYHHNYNLNTVNCRFFNSYGPGEFPGQYRNVIPNFIHWSTLNQSLPVTGDGNETRDFTSVLDLTQGLIKSGHSKKSIGKAFNLASGREIKIIDLVNLINNITGNNKPITHFPARRWDTKKRILASIDLASKTFDYKPIVKFEDGLRETFAWFKLNKEKIGLNADFPPGINSAVRKKI